MTQTYIGTLTRLVCWVCGVHFGLEVQDKDNRVARGKDLWCPNGCHLGFGKSEADKLRDALAAKDESLRLERERSEWQARRAVAAEHQARAYKGVATKVKRRVAAGVCPCCNRTFQDLRRHMVGQHPDFVSERSEA